jgi:hypothetical protein
MFKPEKERASHKSSLDGSNLSSRELEKIKSNRHKQIFKDTYLIPRTQKKKRLIKQSEAK